LVIVTMTQQEIPDDVKCKICGEACKRGVKLGCCSTIACRTCATKTITRDKKCWTCGKEALSKDMINDEELRTRVDKFQKGESTTDAKKDAELMKPPATIPNKTTGASPAKPPATSPGKPPATSPVKPPATSPTKPPATSPAKPPVTSPVKPPVTSPAKPANNQAAKNPEKSFIKSAEEEMKAKATKTAGLKRDADTAKDVSPKKLAVTTKVSLEMMKERNKEFDDKMNNVEKASKELRFGAQLELMFNFDADQACCRMCGENFESEKLTQNHLQHQHKVEYGHLKTVLSQPNNNMLTLCIQKAIKSEFLYAKNQIFPVPVNY